MCEQHTRIFCVMFLLIYYLFLRFNLIFSVNPASNSSTSSETSNSSQQNNGWSFEEQYKQVRQVCFTLCSLYLISTISLQYKIFGFLFSLNHLLSEYFIVISAFKCIFKQYLVYGFECWKPVV